MVAVLAGLAIGASLGALGGGGSILTVPVLVYLLGQSPHQATTASLVVVGVAALAGAAAHFRAGRVRLRAGLAFGAAGVAGSYAGSRLSAEVPANLLLAGFGLLMLTVAALMVARRRVPASPVPASTVPASTVPASPVLDPGPVSPLRDAGVVLAAATGVGLVTGFFGVGGGFVVVPALVLLLGFDLPTAAGTSLVVIAVNSAVALAARAAHASPHLNWRLVAWFAAATVAGTLAGSSLAGRLDPKRLSAAFTALVIVVGGITVVRGLLG